MRDGVGAASAAGSSCGFTPHEQMQIRHIMMLASILYMLFLWVICVAPWVSWAVQKRVGIDLWIRLIQSKYF